MHFASLAYLCFLALVLAASLLLRRMGQARAENMLWLAASYYFYASFSGPFCLCLAGLTLLSYHAARQQGTRAGPWFALGIWGSLGVLGFFKYHDFFAAEVQAAALALGLELSWPLLELGLPLGLSFYAFQNIAYLCDVRWGRSRVHESFLDHALFLAFFPQLLAGPIERSQSLMPQLAAPRRSDVSQLRAGGWLLLFGLYKKLCVADALAPLVAQCFDGSQGFGRGQVICGALLFGLQIYADFSGYTDIARGSARLLGVELQANFRLPFFARNVQDYWTRWHISLSTWIRDYLFYPLIRHPRWGRRLGVRGAVLLGFGVMGAWHGAGWTYLSWGLCMGLLLVGYQGLRPRLAGLRGSRVWTLCAIAVTFAILQAAEILFRAPDLRTAGQMYAALWQPGAGQAPGLSMDLAWALLPLCAHDLWAALRGDAEDLRGCPWLARRLLQWGCVLALLLHLLDGRDTLAQRFLYFAF